MDPHDGAVDHLDLPIMCLRHGIHQAVPDAGFPPAIEAIRPSYKDHNAQAGLAMEHRLAAPRRCRSSPDDRSSASLQVALAATPVR